MDEEIDNKEPEATNTNESVNPFEVANDSEAIKIDAPTDKPRSFDMVPPVIKAENSFKPETVDMTIPVDEEPSITKPVEKKSGKKHFPKNILIILLAVILLAVSAFGAYYYRDNVANDLVKQKDATISTLQTQLAAEVAKNTNDIVDSTSVAPTAAVIENIKSSITSGNTAALEGYMASGVTVVTSSSSEGVSDTAAVSAVTNFIAGATAPWNFALAASVISSYDNNAYQQYFPANAVVGKSANGKVISFMFDGNSKISTILLAATESMLQ